MNIVKTVSVSLFKSKALKMLEEVRSNKKEFLITKRGEAIAKVSPIDSGDEQIKIGHLKDTVTEVEDIVCPIDSDIWGVLK